MPFIQNTAIYKIVEGSHKLAGENSMLIQICDPPGNFPAAKYPFKEVHQFQFLDLEEHDFALEEEMKISQEQANELVKLLQHALDCNMNVIVHCHMGICRSGAVAEVGVMMGFEDTQAWRNPNLLVKNKMLKALGWTYE